MKKENRNLYISLILVLISILMLIAIFIVYSAYDRSNNANSNSNTTTNNNDNNTDHENGVLIEDDKNNESEGEEYRIENYENKNGNFVYVCKKIVDSNDWTIDIPCINSNNENIQKINTKVYNEIVELFGAFEKTNYNIYYNNNVVSYVVELSGFMTDGSSKEYMVFNFNKETFGSINNEELLTIKNVKKQDIIKEYNELLKISFEEEIKEYAKEIEVSENELLNSVSNQKVDTIDDLNLFLDNEGKINLIMQVGMSDSYGVIKIVQTKY